MVSRFHIFLLGNSILAFHLLFLRIRAFVFLSPRHVGYIQSSNSMCMESIFSGFFNTLKNISLCNLIEKLWTEKMMRSKFELSYDKVHT